MKKLFDKIFNTKRIKNNVEQVPTFISEPVQENCHRILTSSEFEHITLYHQYILDSSYEQDVIF